jgi:hypothetical protein
VHPLDVTGDHLDLYVDGVDALATADRNTGGQCDAVNHTYRWTYTPSRTGRVTLQLWDPGPVADNTGGLDVRIVHSVVRDQMTWTVPAAAATGVLSPGALQAGGTYVATVSGAVDAGLGVSADAECSATGAGAAWQRDRSLVSSQPWADHLDVLFDRRDLGGEPATYPADGSRCDALTHTYRFVLEPDETRPVNVRVDDPQPADNTGEVTVSIARVLPVSGPESLRLDTAAPAGATTGRVYWGGEPLLVTVRGTYDLARGVKADAECTSVPPDKLWRTTRTGLVDQRNQQLGDVTVNGRGRDWLPATGTSRCDAATHTYTLRVTPSVTGPLVFGVQDSVLADNVGTLDITVEPAR